MKNIDLLGIFKSLLSFLFSLVKPLLVPIVCFIILFILLLIFWYLYYTIIKKMKKEKPYYGKYTEPNIFYKLLVQLPKRMILDYLQKNPYDFNEYGVHMICGCQGSGKTMTAIYLLQKWKKKYPLIQLYTNCDVKFEDGKLEHWKDLIEKSNGVKGVGNFLDEIQTWFSSLENSKAPVGMLSEVSQQRKQRKAIVGTAQIFGKISKFIREQTHYCYVPRTYFGCLTIVWKAKPRSYDMDKDIFKKKKFAFLFVHTPELRESYDTYKKIEKYKDTEFIQSVFVNTLENESSRV